MYLLGVYLLILHFQVLWLTGKFGTPMRGDVWLRHEYVDIHWISFLTDKETLLFQRFFMPLYDNGRLFPPSFMCGMPVHFVCLFVSYFLLEVVYIYLNNLEVRYASTCDKHGT